MQDPLFLSPSELKDALMKKGYDDIASESTAYALMNYFGYSDTILDNHLSTEERDLFWKMEDDGIVKGEWGWEVYVPRCFEGFPLTPTGGAKLWRIYHWTLRINDIKKLNETKVGSKAAEEETVYSELPTEAWQRGEAGEKT